ncbi:polysaccharide pyruvyl transferase family protein [Stutzerimonas stutzeri]|uniref:polysaccharide pyruvyl transferase family protein n=1 Tax=Stutzerimonas stutzeri TaxID=316 RepID=UPI0024472D82|nr:polysaccharide pyruvyl transferase family protein [Stutzerimonas stutzeri]MDH0101603.1 polysaccharide pyruvyl transferase family protein [Stutzerimonas stutzeri]
MESTIRVLAFGWYGAGNVGDELLLQTLRCWCDEFGVTLAALSIDPEHTRATHGIEATDAYDLPSVACAMQRSDLFVLGGGGLFQTHHKFSVSGLYSYTQADIAAYARPVLMAQQMGVPVLLWAQGVGPLNSAEARDIVRDIFSNAMYVSVRDEGSRMLLNEIGVARDIVVAPDPVWTIPTIETCKPPLTNGKRIAIILRPWAFAQGWEQSFIDAFRDVISKEDRTLVWISFQSHDVPGRSESDSSYLRNLAREIGAECPQEWIEGADISQLIQAIASCDSVISMRLHAQMLALKMDKPVLCVEYDPKMTVVSEQARVPNLLRVRPGASVSDWREAMLELLSSEQQERPLGESGIKSVAASATAHRTVLQQSFVTAFERRSVRSWTSGRFDWLSAWADDLSYRLFAEANGKLAATNQAVAERDGRIARLEQVVTERDGQIAALGQAASERDGEIVALQQTITERDGLIASLNQAVAEREEQIVALHQAAAEQDGLITKLKMEIFKLNVSTSWKITRPMRFLKQFTLSPKRSTYRLLRTIFWNLPAPLRQVLHAPRHRFVRYVRTLPPMPSPSNASATTNDLTWAEFSDRVLANRSNYRGVFIQELVIDWNVPLYQRPQHISAALGRMGFLVVYRTDNWAGDDVEGFREVSLNVWITNRHEVSDIRGGVRSLYSTAYAHTPELIMEGGKRGVLIYEYIDHIDPEISGDGENILRLLKLKEFAFGGGADYIVASSKVLYQEAVDAVGSEKVILVPNGVDTKHYRNPVHDETEVPNALVEFKRKHKTVVGYFGALAPWLWYDVISELVALRSDLGFVFIGPDYYSGSEQLPKSDNVLYLGPVNYGVLPAYAKKFDVCFIPFKPGEIARTTSPLKLFEYFALEKPVVVTSDMVECVEFPEVFSGGSVLGLNEALDKAIAAKDDPQLKKRLADLADQNDWEQRALEMSKAFI